MAEKFDKNRERKIAPNLPKSGIPGKPGNTPKPRKKLSALGGSLITLGSMLLLLGILVVGVYFNLFGMKVLAYQALGMEEATQTITAQLLHQQALLSEREQQVKSHETALSEAQQQLAKDQAALAKDRKALQSRSYEQVVAGTSQVAAYYQTMEPAKCARILEQMQEREAANILLAMEEGAAGAVLSAMEPAFAAAVTQLLIS